MLQNNLITCTDFDFDASLCWKLQLAGVLLNHCAVLLFWFLAEKAAISEIDTLTDSDRSRSLSTSDSCELTYISCLGQAGNTHQENIVNSVALLCILG